MLEHLDKQGKKDLRLFLYVIFGLLLIFGGMKVYASIPASTLVSPGVDNVWQNTTNGDWCTVNFTANVQDSVNTLVNATLYLNISTYNASNLPSFRDSVVYVSNLTVNGTDTVSGFDNTDLNEQFISFTNVTLCSGYVSPFAVHWRVGTCNNETAVNCTLSVNRTVIISPPTQPGDIRTNPTIQLISPLNITLGNNLTFNVSFTDTVMMQNLTLYINYTDYNIFSQNNWSLANITLIENATVVVAPQTTGASTFNISGILETNPLNKTILFWNVRGCNNNGSIDGSNCTWALNGNQSIIIEQTSSDDSTAPAFKNILPVNGTIITNNVIGISFNLTDAIRVQNVTIFVNRSNTTEISRVYNISDLTFALNGSNNSLTATEEYATFNFTSELQINITTNADGYFTYYLHACDNSSNCRDSDNFTYVMDATAPRFLNFTNYTVAFTYDTYAISINTTENVNVSYLRYGDSVNTSENGTYANTSFINHHIVNITNIRDFTLYYYNITICDAGNNCNTTQNSFTSGFRLRSGWNVLGLDRPIQLGALNTLLPSNAVNSIAAWNRTNQSFITFNRGFTVNQNHSMDKYEGVLINTGNHSIWERQITNTTIEMNVSLAPSTQGNWSLLSVIWTGGTQLHNFTFNKFMTNTSRYGNNSIMGNFSVASNYNNTAKTYTDHINGTNLGVNYTIGQFQAVWVWNIMNRTFDMGSWILRSQ